MSESIYRFYERELLFIRQLAQEFINRYPTTAARLLLEANRSADPNVERVLESFALLAGRLHHKLDDEFPELTEALLGVLYPHYLAPVPSLAIVQFELDPARGQLPRGRSLEGPLLANFEKERDRVDAQMNTRGGSARVSEVTGSTPQTRQVSR